jgi:Fic family protein
MSVNMMPSTEGLTVLGSRLERLTGERAECCVPVYRDQADEIAKSRRFQTELARSRALADEGRLLVMMLLRRRKELCACEIQAALGVTHATVSHHMQILHQVGLVEAERRGKWVYYRRTETAARSRP